MENFEEKKNCFYKAIELTFSFVLLKIVVEKFINHVFNKIVKINVLYGDPRCMCVCVAMSDDASTMCSSSTVKLNLYLYYSSGSKSYIFVLLSAIVAFNSFKRR